MTISVERAKELYEELDACYGELSETTRPMFIRSVRALASQVVDEEMHRAVKRWVADHGLLR